VCDATSFLRDSNQAMRRWAALCSFVSGLVKLARGPCSGSLPRIRVVRNLGRDLTESLTQWVARTTSASGKTRWSGRPRWPLML